MNMSNREDQRFIMPHRSTEMFSRMLKKSASIRRLLGVKREKLKVKRRSVEGSSSETFYISPFTKNKDGRFERPASPLAPLLFPKKVKRRTAESSLSEPFHV
jgi:hypothetical protein